MVGVEPGEAYRRYAQGRGINMYAALDELLADNPPRFDLVSLVHVLEHLPDPVGMLSTIRRGFNKRHLLLEVPNFYAHDSFELAHLAVIPRTACRRFYSRLAIMYSFFIATAFRAPRC